VQRFDPSSGWQPKNLQRRRTADPGKIQMAWRLREETILNWQWTATVLVMGAAGYAAGCVREPLKQT
jgi:hypothetical protein